MAVVRNLLRGRRGEFALLRSHPDEPFFGVQLADKKPDTLAEGARLAESRGARFVDLNCGCPIDLITRRGLGASLLRKPGRLARLVAAMKGAVKVPVTVKIRTGWSEAKQNVSDLARAVRGRGSIGGHDPWADARAALQQGGGLGPDRPRGLGARIPVVGNGDILTPYEARDRMQRSGVRSAMLARGALIKPWLFREIREGKSWLPTADERFAVLWRFVELLREHFQDDERGRARALGFLPWHLDFFCRYRPLPEETYWEQSRQHPLLQSRLPLGEPASPLEALLTDSRKETHAALAKELLESGTREEARERALRLQASLPPAEDQELRVAASLVAG